MCVYISISIYISGCKVVLYTEVLIKFLFSEALMWVAMMRTVV